MEKIIAANLKMNFTYEEVKEYISKIDELIDDKRVIIFPGNIYIPYFINKKYSIGIQNVNEKEAGAYTGEVSAMQAKSMNIDYALIGHSERRIYYNENKINDKIKISLKNGLKVILCVGEKEEEKEYVEKVIHKQIIDALDNVKDFNNLIIAYEPIWAVGTNVMPTTDKIKHIIKYIKTILKNKYNIDIPILYGGSINEENINKINEIDDLSGVLVGSSSLIPEKLNKIKEVVLK